MTTGYKGIQQALACRNKLAPHGTDGRLLLTANFKVT